MKTIAIHSYKGGTGKSYLASNLSAIFADRGKVCLLDMDLSAPTLQRLFDEPDREVWLNDYLDGDSELDEMLYKAGKKNLYLGLANSQPDAIRSALGKSKDREMKTLKRLLSLKETLASRGFEKLILDTSPGYEYSSINSIATADKVGLITTLYRPDIFGSRQMIAGLYDILERDAFIIVNRYHSPQKLEEFKNEIRGVFKGAVFCMKCFCDEAEEIGNKVIVLTEPSHPLSGSFRQLALEIEKVFF